MKVIGTSEKHIILGLRNEFRIPITLRLVKVF